MEGRKIFLVTSVLVAIIVVFTLSSNSPEVDYNADIKPIFNKKCISCHGGVKQKSGFSLLFRSEALAVNESGKAAIIPGKPDQSELIRRITANDPEQRMPYKHEALSNEEIAVLRTWIKQGAKWGDHWAYLPVRKTDIPSVHNEWINNDVDRFIFKKLEEQKLTPSQEAEKSVLLRRVSLDLTGMLPNEKIAGKFLSSSAPESYEQLVDSLLASPHYGERWAALWLDVARYADTKGYESDYGRNIWKYRDWVINAFNEDKPYDQFITEQIAGDLLPDPSDAQYIATAFHRNAMSNDEGGTDNEEFRTAAIIDRVTTTWEGLMGTTFSCVQCHSHPYDPFRHEEYYSFMAYFNNTRDEDVPDEHPKLRDFTDSMKSDLDGLTKWVTENQSETEAKSMRHFIRTWQPSINATTADNISNNTLENNNFGLLFRNHSIGRLKKVLMEGSDQLIVSFDSWKPGGVLTFKLDSLTGPLLATLHIKNQTKGKKIVSLDYPKQEGTHTIFITYNNPLIKDPKESSILINWFSFNKQFPGKGKPGYDRMKNLYWKLLTANVPATPIMLENTPDVHRTTHVFERGNWMAKGKEVQPGVPDVLKYALPDNAPKNRLGLAMWLTDKKNPLVSRTLVNRLWEQVFGNGIAETLEDLGTQGIAPTHQDLLDHLSWKLMNDYKWSMKKLLKEIVMSAAYRQSSILTEDTKTKDLFNRYYARGPRIRLTAEQLRDQHLGICGMLNDTIAGPSVMPWQPDGIWLSPYNGSRWKSATDSSQYRRAIYTYWKRSSPYPSMIAFDGAQRNICSARRIRTNTPLQALVTLNDSTYLDMARHFAYRMQKLGGNRTEDQIAKGYELMLFKKITPEKLSVFVNLYRKAYTGFRTDKKKTSEMIGVQDEKNTPETAAMIVVANAMMNIDEVVMKN